MLSDADIWGNSPAPPAGGAAPAMLSDEDVWGKPSAPHESTLSDIGKSAASGLERGAAGMAMVLPNLINQAVAGPQELYRGVTGREHDNSPLWQPFYSSEDVLQNVPDALKPHTPQTPAGTATDLLMQLAGGMATGKVIQSPQAADLMQSQEGAGYSPEGMANAAGSAGNVVAKKILPTQRPGITADAIRSRAGQAYNEAETQGGTLNPNITNSFIDSANKTLPQTQAGKLVLGETPTTKLVENMQALRDKPLSLAEAQEIDSALSDKMNSEVDPRTGKLNADGSKLLKIQQSLRAAIENAGPTDIIGGKDGFDAWNQGRQLWSASARMNEIERIMNRAADMDNPVTAIKTGFRTLANNPTRLRGYTPDEVEAIQRAAKTGVVTDALRLAGSRLVPIISGATGFAGGPGGGALGAVTGYGVSSASRAAANALQAGRGNAVLQEIANRPAVQSAFKRGGVVQPTPAQKIAGNYKKGHARLHGLDITIENPKGSERSGVDKDGKPWSVKMPHHYGYIRGSAGADGDHVDAYIGPNEHSRRVYLVHQKHLDSGRFDELKAMIGFPDRQAAMTAYHSSFSDGKEKHRVMKVERMMMPEFKEWLKSTVQPKAA